MVVIKVVYIFSVVLDFLLSLLSSLFLFHTFLALSLSLSQGIHIGVAKTVK